jgi:hypothetical protein
MGPFQNTVFAMAMRLANPSRASGPMSRPSQPSGTCSAGTTFHAASGSNAAAATTSLGSFTGTSIGLARISSAILPPTRTTSACSERLRRTPILSSTLAPPTMATKGRSGCSSSLPSSWSSRSSSRPA